MRTSLVLPLACVLVALAPVASANPYPLRDLGTIGGRGSEPVAINNGGWIVGTSKTPDELTRAVVWDPTNDYAIIDLGGGPSGQGNTCVAINDAGQVVGNMVDPSGSSFGVFTWNTTTRVVAPLPLPPDSVWTASQAVGINASGQITGVLLGGGRVQAFIYDDTNGLLELGTIGAATYIQPTAINNVGQVIGFYIAPDNSDRGFIWDLANGIRDLGTLGGPYAFPTAINNLGQVVGFSQTDTGETHAFFWEGDVMSDLGTLGGSVSAAYDINDAGQIVGGASQAGSFDFYAFICDESHVLNNLDPTPGGQNGRASAISETGLVIGEFYVAGHSRAMFWDLARGLVNLGTLGGSESISLAVNDGGLITGTAVTAGGENHAMVVDVNSLPPQGVQSAVVDSLEATQAAATQPQDIKALDKIIADLEKTEAPSLWVDATHLDTESGDALFKVDAKAVGDCEALLRSTKDGIPDADLQEVIEDLVNNTAELAETAVDDAATLLGIPMALALRTANTPKESKASKQLTEARKELARAQSQVARGKYQEAIKSYGQAWKKAQTAMRTR